MANNWVHSGLVTSKSMTKLETGPGAGSGVKIESSIVMSSELSSTLSSDNSVDIVFEADPNEPKPLHIPSHSAAAWNPVSFDMSASSRKFPVAKALRTDGRGIGFEPSDLEGLALSDKRRLRRLVHPDKRKRTAAACDSCRKRKQKCDGKHPCRLCVIKSFECVYSRTYDPLQLIQRTLSSKDESNGPENGLQITRHDSDVVSHTSRQPSTTYADGNGSAVSPSTHIPDHNHSVTVRNHDSFSSDNHPDHPVHSEHVISHSSPKPEISSSTSTSSLRFNDLLYSSTNNLSPTPNSPHVSSSSGSPPQPASYNLETTGDGKETRILFDPAGHLRYIGESCMLSMLEQIRRLFRKSIGESSFTEDPQRFNVVDGPVFRTAATPLQLPSKPLALQLLHLFEVHVHYFTYVFQMDNVYQMLEDSYNDPMGTPYSALCLLHLVFAIGAVHAKVIHSRRTGNVTEREPPDSQKFLESALYFLIDAIEDGELWVVQAYFMCSLYYESVCKRNASWMQLGLAIRYAQALGMGRKWVDRKFPPDIQLHRQRLWRSLFIHDRLRSASLGRQLTLNSSDMEDYTTAELYVTNFDRMQVEFTKLCTIIGDIWDHVYGSQSIQSRTAQNLTGRLKRWSGNLDLVLKNPLNSGENPPWDRNFLLLLNLTYLNGVILLTRPFLLFTIAERTQQPHSQAPDQHGMMRTFEKLSGACVHSAGMSARLVETVFNTQTHPQLSPQLIYYTFTAGIMLTLETFRRPRTSNTAVLESLINSCSQTLEYYGVIDRSAQRYFYILKEMNATVQNNNLKSPLVSEESANHQPVLSLAYQPLADSGEFVDVCEFDFSGPSHQWSFTYSGPIMNSLQLGHGMVNHSEEVNTQGYLMGSGY